jgi:hypothetical protein
MAKALGDPERRDRAVVPMLVEMVSDPSHYVSRAALEALRNIDASMAKRLETSTP